MYSFSIVVIENLYIQTSLMVALSLFRVKEGGGTFINQRWTLYDASNALVLYIYLFIMSPSNIQFPSSPLNRMRRSHLDDPNFREEYETESCRLGRHRLH